MGSSLALATTWLPAALGSPWLVPTLAARQVGAVCTSVVSRAIPAHPSPYDPAAQHTYEGRVSGSRTTRGLAAVTRTTPPAATTANNANTADPVEAPSPASSFRQAMGVVHALRRQEFQKLCVCMRVFACVRFIGRFG